MPYRSNIDKRNDIERYLRERAISSFGGTLKKTGISEAQVKGWREDSDFRKREVKAKKAYGELRGQGKGEKKVKIKTETKGGQSEVKPHRQTAPKETPISSPSPIEEKPQVENIKQTTISRQIYDEQVQQYRLDLINRLKSRGIYNESDNVQIEVVAKELATLDRYEDIRLAPGYALMCPVRSTALLELNPLEDKYMGLLRQITRHLQSLGLNHDAKDFTTKKKKGVIDKDELNLLYGNGETGLIKAAES